jgi:type IV secretory pathway TrbD component
VPHDDNPVYDSTGIPWPLFVSLLLANGWFLRPVPFDQQIGGARIEVRLLKAGIRIPIFAAAWVAAFSVLPLWIPTLALAGWIAKITPGVRTINRRFQNVGPNENPA